MPLHGAITAAADLHRPGVQSNSDPGAIGAYKIWIDTGVDGSPSSPVLKIRNATDAGWVNISGSAAPIQSTLVDAKGDLIAATAADTVARLAVGNNGTMLVADSGQSTGLAWQRGIANGVTTLTDGATITWDFANRYEMVATVTLGGDRTLAFSNLAAGCRGTLIVKQDASAPRTLTLPSGSKVVDGGAGAITLTATNNAVDVLGFVYDGTNSWWTYGLNFT